MNICKGEWVTICEPDKPSYVAVVTDVGDVNALVLALDGTTHCVPPDWIYTWDDKDE